MGVMTCSRNDCNNIMCDIYVQSVGYICNECKSEFNEYLQQMGLNPTSYMSITKALQTFMATPKDTYTVGNETTIDEFFNDHTG